MQIPEGNPYSLDDHRAVYKALITRLDTEREIAFGTVGAALVHSGMKERFGYGKPKPFLEHFSEFMTFIDRVAGGVPQRWVVLHRVPEWDAELGISSANASAGQMVGACVEQMIGTSASAETTGRETTAPASESPAAADAATPQSIARSVVASDKYRAAPIDEATRAELEPSFRGFVFVPYASADILRANVPPATDINALLEESWSAAYAAGAFRAFEDKVTFPIAAMRSDGKTPIEASIQRTWRENPEHKQWYLCYVDAKTPYVSRPRVQIETPSEEALAVARTMASTEEYRSQPLPPDTQAQMLDRYSDFVFTTYSSRAIIQDSASGVDVDYLLEESWMAARQEGALRFYEGKVVFPLNAFCADGVSPIEASITVATKGNAENKPWYLCYIDTYAKRNTYAGNHPSKHLEKFAWLGTWTIFWESLPISLFPNCGISRMATAGVCASTRRGVR